LLYRNTKTHFSKSLPNNFDPTDNTFQMWTPLKTLLNFLSHQKLFSNQNTYQT